MLVRLDFNKKDIFEKEILSFNELWVQALFYDE